MLMPEDTTNRPDAHAHPHTRLQEEQYETPVPVILDRCHQARVRSALEPEWEARFEPRSYGFRPGRGCHDAIESLYNTLCGKSRRALSLGSPLCGTLLKNSHRAFRGRLRGLPARARNVR